MSSKTGGKRRQQRPTRQFVGRGSNVGRTPAIVLIDPKFARNVASALRGASCYGIDQLWWTGDRVQLDIDSGQRLPREERMKGYGEVDLINSDYPFDAMPAGTVPVAIEIRENSEQLPEFEHPDNAIYVFGPEDGSIPKPVLAHCQRFVMVPTAHCMNLAATVNVVMYDRMAKRRALGLDPILPTWDYLNEDRTRTLGLGDLRDRRGVWNGEHDQTDHGEDHVRDLRRRA